MSAETTSSERNLSHREILTIITGLALGMLLAALDQTIVSTALPTIVGDLKGATHLSWVVTAYLLTTTAATPLYGKISDLYGRKRIYIFAICTFLLGSVLCGAAQNLPQLIAFRAVQGVGAGGLMTLAFAIIGDVVSPRERGRYQGYFGAVFGLSSVIGPLVGGTLTQHLSWRWIFYVNVPIGLIALAVVILSLHLPKKRTEHKVDYLGAGLITASVASLLLVSVWGGGHPGGVIQRGGQAVQQAFTGYAWTSPEILGLLALGIVTAGLFLWQESRHSEPIIPLELFKDSIFSVSVALSFVSGAALFGAVIYLPQFQQIVKGFTPTDSGLLMIPLTIGIVAGAVGSGRAISAMNRYRIFPIIGTALLTFGFVLLSLIQQNTNQWMLSLWMIIIGVGIGLFMQVTTLAVQNAVDFKHMGAATASVTFFRTLGGSFGTAIFGAILNNRIAFNMPKFLNGAPSPDLDAIQPAIVHTFPPAIQNAVFESYTRGLHVVFLWAVPISVIAFGLSLALKDKHLRSDSAVQRSNEDAPSAPAFE